MNNGKKERRKVEIEKARMIQFLNETQSVAHVGSWEKDYITGERFCSDELYRILGYDKGEFEPTMGNFLMLVHPDDLVSLYNAIYDMPVWQKKKT